MSEESENNNCIIKKSLRPVPSQGMVEQAKKIAASDPSSVSQKTLEDPESEVAEEHLIKNN